MMAADLKWQTGTLLGAPVNSLWEYVVMRYPDGKQVLVAHNVKNQHPHGKNYQVEEYPRRARMPVAEFDHILGLMCFIEYHQLTPEVTDAPTADVP